MTGTRSSRPSAALSALAAAAAAIALAAPARGEGSEVPDGSVAIKKLPFTDTGDTTNNTNDFDVICPFSGSTAPDVFYAITPLTDMSIDITLCNSGYDTKLYVLDESLQEVACNDDFCEDKNGDPTLRSELQCVPLMAGMLYHIGVDGFGGEFGPYEITVSVCVPPPPFMCPDGATPEGETCQEGAPDTFNAGCNADPPVFSPIACDETICGETWQDEFSQRDTDWYQVVTDVPTRFTLSGEFSFASGLFGLVFNTPGREGSGDCDDALGVNPFVTGGPGEVVSVTTDQLPPGTYWFFVSVSTNDVVPCAGENDYWIKLTCDDSAGCNPACPADVTGDGTVDFADVLELLVNWGPCPP